MKYKRKIFKSFFKSIFILGIINVFLIIQSNYAYAKTNKIKVGYTIISGFSEVKDGEYSGFLFDYLREISKYTGWEYEFIEFNDDEIYSELKSGKIDIIGAVKKNEETMNLYDFPEYNSGASYTTLVTLKDNDSIYMSNFKTLNEIKVGYFEEEKDKLKNFNEFYEANGFKNVELISYSSEDKYALKEALINKEVDAIITDDLSLDREMKVIVKFSPEPYYFATTKGNDEIIADLNKAISRIKEKDSDYGHTLYSKYFNSFNSKVINLTKEEEEYVSNIETLKGIYIDNNMPVQYYNNKTNEANGIYIDLVSLIMKRVNINFELIKASNYEEAYSMIKNREADFILALPDKYLVEKEHNLFLTQSYIDIDLVKVKNIKSTQGDNEVGALVKGYRYNDLNSENVKYYETIEECLDAIDKGEATVTSFNSYSILNYISSNYYPNLAVLYQEKQVGVSMGFVKPIDKTLINIINKSIDNLSNEEVNNIIYDNSTNIHHKITLRQIIIENTEEFISTSIVTVILIFIITIYKIKKLKQSKELLLKKAQTDALTGAYNRETGEILIREYLKTNPKNLYSAFAIIDVDNFKLVNDRLGHQIGDNVLKEFASILKNIFTFKDIICRLGGDEFIIFMKDIEKFDFDIIRDRLEALCKTMNKDIEDNNIKQKISLSIGCVITNKYTNFKEVYKKADEMLYEVKHSGKNGFKIKNDFIN